VYKGQHPDLSVREIAVIVPVMAAILVIGVFPRLLLDRIDPTTTSIVTRVECTGRSHCSPHLQPAVVPVAGRGP